MTNHHVLLFLSTFFTGLAIGVYIFFVGYSPIADSVTDRAENLSDTLVIVGEAYGGCSRLDRCPTFRISDEGEYRYFHWTNESDKGQLLREGELPRSLQAELRRSITKTELQVASRPIEPALCDSYVDGIDVRYKVILNGIEHTLDSCGTDVDGEGQLWRSLSNIWRYFETI